LAVFLIFASVSIFVITPSVSVAAPEGTRLVVFIIVDGLSEETFADNAYAYGESGFLFLMQNGAWFENAHYGHATTLTGPGHATVMTGTDPLRHGIVGNVWADRKTGVPVYCVDPKSRAVHLRVPTIGDVLIDATHGRSRVFSVGGKDRSAILCAGKKGTAYYYDRPNERFARWPAGRVQWKYDAKRSGPSEDTLVLDFAEELVRMERLGAEPPPDVLVLALSSVDLLSHHYGPKSEEVRKHLIDLDARLADFLGFLNAKVGLEKTFIILTSDHGFTEGQPVGMGPMTAALDTHLTSVFGKTGLVLTSAAPWIYLNNAVMKTGKLDAHAVEAEAKQFLAEYPGVAAVFTQSEAFEGTTSLAKAVRRSWKSSVAGDLYVVPVDGKFLVFENKLVKFDHGTPYEKDTHVPVIFFGAPFTDGLYDEPIETVDIVPTVAEALGLDMSPVDGTPLTETFKKAARS
jgi:predicted AlkP superfamily pyrophosphatase or phosphodiesterase